VHFSGLIFGIRCDVIVIVILKMFLLILVLLPFTSASSVSNHDFHLKCSTLCGDKSNKGEVNQFMKHLCHCSIENNQKTDVSVVQRDANLCDYLCSQQQGGDACRCRNPSLPGKRHLEHVQHLEHLQTLRPSNPAQTTKNVPLTNTKYRESVAQRDVNLCDYLCSIQMGGDACRCRNPSLPGKRHLEHAKTKQVLSLSLA